MMRHRYHFLTIVLLAVIIGAVCAWMAQVTWRGELTPFSIGQPGKTAVVAINFGKVYYGQRATRMLTVVNASGRRLLLGEKTGCGCTQVKISKPALPPGERSMVRVSYSGIDPGLTGPASQQFLIFDTGNALIPELHGVVRAFLAQSLRFSRTEVSWRYVEGRVTHDDRPVIAENVSGDPIKVAWRAGGIGRFFSVRPASAVVVPGGKAVFLFRPSAAMARDNHPEAGIIKLLGALQSKGESVPLDFTFDVYATPVPILEVIPGALVISPSSGVHSISSIIRLVMNQNAGKPPHVLAVTTNSPELLAALKDGKILVSLHLTPGQTLFQGDIHIIYSHDGIRSLIDVPVFAAPDIVGP